MCMYSSMSIAMICMCKYMHNGDLNTQCSKYWNIHRERPVQTVTPSLNVNTQKMNTNVTSNVTALGNTQGGMCLSEKNKFHETLQEA